MALNGVLEAFVQGVAEAEQLKPQLLVGCIFSSIFSVCLCSNTLRNRWFDCCKHCENVMPNLYALFSLKPYMVNRQAAKQKRFG